MPATGPPMAPWTRHGPWRMGPSVSGRAHPRVRRPGACFAYTVLLEANPDLYGMELGLCARLFVSVRLPPLRHPCEREESSARGRSRTRTTQRQRSEKPVRGSAIIETGFPVAAHARGHNFEFGAPGQSQLVQGVGTTSSERALRRAGVPRRSYSTASSYSSSSSSMLMAWRSPIDQRATIRMMLHPTYQSPS